MSLDTMSASQIFPVFILNIILYVFFIYKTGKTALRNYIPKFPNSDGF